MSKIKNAHRAKTGFFSARKSATLMDEYRHWENIRRKAERTCLRDGKRTLLQATCYAALAGGLYAACGATPALAVGPPNGWAVGILGTSAGTSCLSNAYPGTVRTDAVACFTDGAQTAGIVAYKADGTWGSYVNVRDVNNIFFASGTNLHFAVAGAEKLLITTTQVQADVPLNMTSNRIVSLAVGTASTDAVNVSQLSSVISGFGGGADFNTTTGLMDPPTYVINGTTYNDVGSALGNLNKVYTGGGIKYFHANSSLDDSTATGLNSTAIGPAAIATDDYAVALGYNSVTAPVVGTPNVTINGTTYNFAGPTPASTVSIGTPTSRRTLTNLAAGRISSDSTDGINGSQLFATNDALGNLATTVNDINGGAGIMYFHTNSTLADSTATGTNSVAIGPVANAATDQSIAIGNATVAGAGVNQNAIAVGHKASSTGESSVVIGNSASTTVDNAVALGSGSVAAAVVATTSVSINGVTYNFAGNAPMATVAIGGSDRTRTLTYLAAGRISSDSTDGINGSQLFATNQAVDSLATTVNDINDGAGIMYFHANSSLPDSAASGTNSVAIGPEATAANAGDVALGYGSKTALVVNTPSVTIDGVTYNFKGTAATSTVSIGSAGNERTLTNLAAGRISSDSTDGINGSQLFATNQAVDSLATTVNNINDGAGIMYFHANSTLSDSTATGTNSVAIGPEAKAVSDSSIAIGNGAVAGAAPAKTGAIALGDSSSATGQNSLALGTGASTSVDNTVALGANSVAAAAVATTSVALAGVTYNFAGGAPVGTVSIGSAGNERTLTNLAAGRIDSDSTDAINGSQLNATNLAVNSLSTSISSGTMGPVQRKALDTLTLVGDGGTAANPGNPQLLTNVKAGAVNASSTDAINGSQLYDLGSNAASALGGGASYTGGTWVGPTYALSSGTFTNVGGALVNLDGRVVTNTTAINDLTTNINDGTVGPVQRTATPDRLTLVADGGTAAAAGAAQALGNVANGDVNSSSTDAINGSQLYDLADSVSIAIGGGMTVNGDGSVTQPSFSVGGTSYNSVGKAFEVIDQQLTSLAGGNIPVKYFHANSTLADSIASGQESVAIGGAARSDGENSVAMGANASSSGSGSIAIGSGAQASQAGSVALGEGSVADRAPTPSSGTIAAGGNGNVSIAYNTTDRTLAGAVSVGSDTSYRQLTNVADGQSDFDAVNMRQLRGGLESAVGYMDGRVNALDGRVTALEQQFFVGNAQVMHRIGKIENRLSGGIAATAAMGAIPYIDPGKTFIGASIAGYNGQGGFGAVLAHRSADGSMVLHAGVGVASGGSKPVGRVGVGYQF